MSVFKNLQESKEKLVSIVLAFGQSQKEASAEFDAAVESAKAKLKADREKAVEKMLEVISESYGETSKEDIQAISDKLTNAPLEADNSSSMDVKVTTE